MAKTAKTKHAPIRTCIACRKKAEKRGMIRVVRISEGEVQIDAFGKVRGRGANLCPNIECFDTAAKTKRFKSALNLEQALSTDKIEQMRKDFEQVLHEREFRTGKRSVTLRVQKKDLHNLVGEK